MAYPSSCGSVWGAALPTATNLQIVNTMYLHRICFKSRVWLTSLTNRWIERLTPTSIPDNMHPSILKLGKGLVWHDSSNAPQEESHVAVLPPDLKTALTPLLLTRKWLLLKCLVRLLRKSCGQSRSRAKQALNCYVQPQPHRVPWGEDGLEQI